MAITTAMVGQLPLHLLNGRINYPSDDIRVVLLDSGYSFNQDTHDFLDDLALATNEIAPSAGYTANGQALTGKSVTYDSATNRTRALASDSSWPGLDAQGAQAPRSAFVYDRTPASDATRPLMSYVNFGADQPVVGGTFTLDWNNTDGIFYYTVAAEA